MIWSKKNIFLLLLPLLIAVVAIIASQVIGWLMLFKVAFGALSIIFFLVTGLTMIYSWGDV